jgi:U4/U6 small nuclear ribonucleoprotein PRP31
VLTLGILDTDGGGVGILRKKVKARKTRQANTKASRKRQAQAIKSVSNDKSGLASSMVFTPVQGMELVDPEARTKRVADANKMWFSKDAGFQSAIPK